MKYVFNPPFALAIWLALGCWIPFVHTFLGVPSPTVLLAAYFFLSLAMVRLLYGGSTPTLAPEDLLLLAFVLIVSFSAYHKGQVEFVAALRRICGVILVPWVAARLLSGGKSKASF